MQFLGKWPQHLKLFNRWITDQTGIAPYTVTPSNLSSLLPVIKTGLAPSGSFRDFERSVSVDVDLFTASWADMNPLIQTVDTAIAKLPGNGNQYGYVDDVTGGSFANVDYADSNILRCTATFSLTVRPTN